ncbi:coenzyme PQQ synthesis protein D (PqqD) [Algoriphagus boseongensis]|uniref:Coenzyme PQQ synthesis protein D (PqqD) n=1 Tax=Algoriphagus boseongensis TaxID=1442587 RepID=A0A4R6TCF6_9BACT|nr:PqqD family protein [Algoriphagus boseongensis]TDQ19395.1 coenzyme PQQ synthesis protein D (PqqD) [Algoriphagus boseongensis]
MENKYFKLDENRFLFTEIDNEGILFDVETYEYLNLNSTFCSIFNHLRNNLGLVEIKEKLMQEYEVSDEVCEAELLESVRTLLDKKLMYEKSDS